MIITELIPKQGFEEEFESLNFKKLKLEEDENLAIEKAKEEIKADFASRRDLISHLLEMVSDEVEKEVEDPVEEPTEEISSEAEGIEEVPHVAEPIINSRPFSI